MGTQQVAGIDSATSLASIPMVQQRNFMQALSPATRGVQKCYRAVVLNAEVQGKKKGYKIVEGREVPFNLFKPKEPLKAKVVANQVHKHTITENTGDPNWETVHVTFDHGGKY